MTTEEKELLLKDLCARLPYRTKILITVDTVEGRMEIDADLTTSTIDYFMSWTVQPYLRPMSSMTEEEEKELKSILPFGISFSWDVNNEFIIYTDSEYDGDHYFSCFVDIQDWHNAHHFDYRNLIEKGLALEAPEGMYEKGGSK